MKQIAIIIMLFIGLSAHAEHQHHFCESCGDTIPAHIAISLDGLYSDHNKAQLQICEDVLDLCVEYGALDTKGCECYNMLKKQQSISMYQELIAECYEEDVFLDVISEMDAFYMYLDLVLPYHKLNN